MIGKLILGALALNAYEIAREKKQHKKHGKNHKLGKTISLWEEGGFFKKTRVYITSNNGGGPCEVIDECTVVSSDGRKIMTVENTGLCFLDVRVKRYNGDVHEAKFSHYILGGLHRVIGSAENRKPGEWEYRTDSYNQTLIILHYGKPVMKITGCPQRYTANYASSVGYNLAAGFLIRCYDNSMSFGDIPDKD